MAWKNLNFLVMGILIFQPVEAHRKYWDSDGQNEIIIESNDLADHNITSDGTVTKKKDNTKKSSSSTPNKNVTSKNEPALLKENSTTPKNNSASSQMPTAMKGVGIPGSPHQAEVPHEPGSKDIMSKDSAAKASEGSNVDHGHLIQIPQTPSN